MKKENIKSLRNQVAVACAAVILSIPFIPSTTIVFNPQYVAPSLDEPAIPSVLPKKYTQKEIKDYKIKEESLIFAKLEQDFSPDDSKIALAVLKQESSLNPEAKNYNCFYIGDTVYEYRAKGSKSRSCQSGHEQYAYSVDCGISQINFDGKKQCPDYSFGVDWSLSKMAEIHAERGFGAWVGFTSGAYLAYLK